MRLLQSFWVLFTILATVNVQAAMPKADLMIQSLYHKLGKEQSSTMSSRLSIVSAYFIGKPYQLGALGEGRLGRYDQFPLYRTDAFDCLTYVETVLAIALSPNLKAFKQTINHIRYQDGHVSYLTRLHFTELDWNKAHQRQHILKDITDTFRDEKNQPVARTARATIDKPMWIQHLSKAAIRLRQKNPTLQEARLTALKQKGPQLTTTVVSLPYLPLTALFDADSQPNRTLFQQIPNGAIIEIIRPNWDLTETVGTHLNVSHIGFAFWHQGILYFRNASSLKGRVVDQPLIAYLAEARKNPTIKGINVQVIIKDRDRNNFLFLHQI